MIYLHKYDSSTNKPVSSYVYNDEDATVALQDAEAITKAPTDTHSARLIHAKGFYDVAAGTSSKFTDIFYNEEEMKLHVLYTGGAICEYSNVPVGVVHEIDAVAERSESVGSWLAKNVELQRKTGIKPYEYTYL